MGSGQMGLAEFAPKRGLSDILQKTENRSKKEGRNNDGVAAEGRILFESVRFLRATPKRARRIQLKNI